MKHQKLEGGGITSKENDCDTGMLYPTKLSISYQRKRRAFVDIQELNTHESNLKEILE